MNWTNISIGKYQQAYPVIGRQCKTPLEKLEQQIDILMILDEQPREHYEALTQKGFALTLERYLFVFVAPTPRKPPRSFKVNGIRFWMDYNPANVKERLRARDVVDLTTIIGNEALVIANMHKILAGYVDRSRTLGLFKRSFTPEMLLDLDVQTAIDITAFFLRLLAACLPVMGTYLQEEVRKVRAMDSISIGNGMQRSTT